jgi:hypothetical protein
MPSATLEADPADELRRKLAEARHSAEPEVEAERDTAAETLEERRARVHAKAQEAIDTMHVEEP